ncbi:hypothetical protein RJ639_002166 [Escallonia herrerae]|uniref:Glutamate decarboxylase n=1 Tax=Escallonia herrerae TaxID=1293975 RepID=A0AA88XC98_9ASTE|nr:hypothetical protein RJ639_002166 [Escallonia herrerae]
MARRWVCERFALGDGLFVRGHELVLGDNVFAPRSVLEFCRLRREANSCCPLLTSLVGDMIRFWRHVLAGSWDQSLTYGFDHSRTLRQSKAKVAGIQMCLVRRNRRGHRLELLLYFEVELKEVHLKEGYYIMDPVKAVNMVDENTICVAAILGSTLTGEFEDVKLLNELLTKKNKETGWETPIHVDAASGGFIAPFLYPDLEWDFRLPLVKSINVSGHKYGLVYAGVGWVVWRSKDDLPEELIFHINYLGSDQPTFTLNFSRGASQIIAQYYQFIRLGFEGYKNIMENCKENARVLKQGIEKMGRFEIVSKDVGVPLLAFALKDSNSGHTVFEISESLRRFGWIIPAYTMPPDAQHVAVLRVVIREEFSHSLAERLISDIEKVLKEMDASPGRVSVQEKQKVGAHSVQKSARETEEEVTRQWRRFVDGRKTSGVC